jgi:hypothetical protein
LILLVPALAAAQTLPEQTVVKRPDGTVIEAVPPVEGRDRESEARARERERLRLEAERARQERIEQSRREREAAAANPARQIAPKQGH